MPFIPPKSDQPQYLTYQTYKKYIAPSWKAHTAEKGKAAFALQVVKNVCNIIRASFNQLWYRATHKTWITNKTLSDIDKNKLQHIKLPDSIKNKAGQEAFGSIKQQVAEVKYTCEMLEFLGASKEATALNTEVTKVESEIQKFTLEGARKYADLIKKQDQTVEARAEGRNVEPNFDFNPAFERYKAQAALGNPKAKLFLGYCYEKDLGVDQDIVHALKLYQEAAQRNVPEALNKLATFHLNGLEHRGMELIKKDPQRAKELYTASASGGNIKAMLILGDLLTKEGNKPGAIERYKQAARQHSPEAMEKLGDLYMEAADKDSIQAAYSWYIKGADFNHLPCIKKAAHHIDTKHGIDPSKQSLLGNISTKLHRQAADLGDAESQIEYARRLQTGDYGLLPQPLEAINYYTRAVDQGNAQAMYLLGVFHEKGHPYGYPPVNQAKAMEWFTKAAEAGSSEAAFHIGTLHEAQKNIAEAVKWYDKALDLNDYNETAREHLYRLGEGLIGNVENADDPVLAFKILDAMADDGDIDAMYEVGYCYSKGIGVKKDKKTAMDIFKHAANKGDGLSACTLGNIYAQKKQFDHALKWYLRGVELGNLRAMEQLAAIYYEGNEGIAKDDEKAIAMNLKAIEQGSGLAASNLAYLYETRGDLDEALKWWNKAIELGFEKAKSYLEKLEDKVIFNNYKLKDYNLKGAIQRYLSNPEAPQAISNLYYCMEAKYGTKEDMDNAIVVFQKYADQQYANQNPLAHKAALSCLGLCHLNGIGVPSNPEAAEKLFRRAADAGDIRALSEIAIYFHWPKHEFEQCVDLFTKGAQQGDTVAMEWLAQCYEQGLGIPENKALAAEWRKKAQG